MPVYPLLGRYSGENRQSAVTWGTAPAAPQIDHRNPAAGPIAASSLLAKLSAPPVEHRPKDPSAFDWECFWSQLCNRCRFAFAVVVPAASAQYREHQKVVHDPSDPGRTHFHSVEPRLQRPTRAYSTWIALVSSAPLASILSLKPMAPRLLLFLF